MCHHQFSKTVENGLYCANFFKGIFKVSESCSTLHTLRDRAQHKSKQGVAIMPADIMLSRQQLALKKRQTNFGIQRELSVPSFPLSACFAALQLPA